MSRSRQLIALQNPCGRAVLTIDRRYAAIVDRHWWTILTVNK